MRVRMKLFAHNRLRVCGDFSNYRFGKPPLIRVLFRGEGGGVWSPQNANLDGARSTEMVQVFLMRFKVFLIKVRIFGFEKTYYCILLQKLENYAKICFFFYAK